jgi:hypothetical protein
MNYLIELLPSITWPQVAFFALFIAWEFILGKQNRVIPKSTLGLIVAGFFILTKYLKERKWTIN